jgi:hypothetical protein
MHFQHGCLNLITREGHRYLSNLEVGNPTLSKHVLHQGSRHAPKLPLSLPSYVQAFDIP